MFDLGKAVGYLLLDTTGFTAGFQSAGTQIQTFLNKSNSVQTRVAALGGAFTSAGATMTKGFTVPLLGIATAAVKVTADFDSQMSKVAAISGATGKEFDALRDKAREMGEKTQFSATEAGQAFEYMAMAGWKTEDMLNGIEGIMNLAAASGEELATTSDIVTDALTAFGLQASDSAHFADVLAAASSNSNTNVAMMGETFKYVAPVADALGYSAEDTAVAIGLMANSGIKASSAGTSLRGILNRMVKPTKESAWAMDVLGVSLEDGNGEMYSLMEIMEQLREGFRVNLRIPAGEVEEQMLKLDAQFEAGEITEKQYAEAQDELMQRAYGAEGALKAKAAAALGGRTAMSGLLAVVNASDKDFQKLTYSIQHSSDTFVKTTDGAIIPMSQALEEGIEWVEEYSGEAEKMAAIMRDNLKGQIKILIFQLQELAISIGDILMPKLRNIVAKIQEWVDKFNKMDQGTKETIVNIGLFVAAVGPVLLIIGKVITTVSTVIEVIGKAKTALTALFTVMSAHPIAIVIAAITALVAAFVYLWNNNEKFREFWINLWNKFKEVVSNTVERIKYDFEILKLAIDIIKDWFKQKIDDIKEFFSGLKDKIHELVERIKYDFEILKLAIGIIKDQFKQKIDDIKEFFSGLKDRIHELVERVKSDFELLKTALDLLKNWFKEKFDSIKNTIKETVERIKADFEILKAALEIIKSGFQEKFDAIKAKISETVERIKADFELLKAALEILQNWFKEKFESIKGTIKGTVERIKSDFELFRAAFDSLKNSIKERINAIKESFNDLKTNIKTTWENIISTISTAVQNIITRITNFATSMYNGAKNAIIRFKAGLIEVWHEVLSWIHEALSGLLERVRARYDSFRSAGHNLLTYFKNGMIEKWNDIVSWVVDKLNWLQEKWNSAQKWIGGLKSSGSYATGTDYILSDRLVQVHEGEAILSKEENQNRMKSGVVGNAVIPITLNITETIDGMTLAKNQHKYNLVLDDVHGPSLIKT